MPTQILSTVALLVPDYDAGIAFFVEGLEWDLISDTPQPSPKNPGKRWVVVAPPGAQTRILLAQADNADQRAAIGKQIGGRVGFFLQTDDFEATAARITDAGGALEETPRDEPYGRVAVWRDPFGNRWDLIAPAG